MGIVFRIEFVLDTSEQSEQETAKPKSSESHTHSFVHITDVERGL